LSPRQTLAGAARWAGWSGALGRIARPHLGKGGAPVSARARLPRAQPGGHHRPSVLCLLMAPHVLPDRYGKTLALETWRAATSSAVPDAELSRRDSQG
jgi:hypothetical protein